jgi:photosystem II stability/assembly factor-like uncharacterized protein
MRRSPRNTPRLARTLLVLVAGWFTLAMIPGPVWAAISDWTSLGPEGGSINAISINPRDPNALYAGTTYASFTSGNGGRSWVKSAIPNPNLIPSPDLIFDLQNPNIIYARPPLNYLGPLFKSTDQGKNWKHIEPPGTSIVDFVVGFQDPNTMLVAATRGIFKSTDAGESWRAVNSGLVPQTTVQTLAIHPQDQNTLYVGTRSGVFKTTDGAETWNIVKEGNSDSPSPLTPRMATPYTSHPLTSQYLGAQMVERRGQPPTSDWELPFSCW